MDPESPTPVAPPANPATVEPATAVEKPPYEQATDEWRQVWHEVWTPFDRGVTAMRYGFYSLQRRFLVSTGPARYALEDPPIDRDGNEIPYVNVPGNELWWWSVKGVWKDLPVVTAEEVARERAEAGEGIRISTT